MEKPKNGSWKFITVLITCFLTLIGYVVANDRFRVKGDRENDTIRATEDIRIVGEVDTKIEKVEVRVIKRLDDFQMEQRIQGKEISGLRADSKNNVETLARIEAEL